MSVASQQSSVPAAGAAHYRVGDLTIDLGSQRVTRGEDEISLPKLSFDLLLVLVRAAPNLVSLDGLMHEVWPNLVVNPETVSQRVKLLRDALGDDPHAPRYIEGLRGRGYRLIAPVSRVASAPSEEVRETSAPASDLPQRRASSVARRRWWIAGGLATVVLAVGTTSVVVTRMRDSTRDSPAPASSVTVSALPERTVAVLPFANLSGEARDEFVALGVAEGVLHRLAGIRDLTLIARSSSFALRDKPADAREIGLKLNARYLVEGSVQRAADRLRVTAQLIDAATGAHVWSLRFDRTMDDIFAVEDEISHSVARALEVSLTQSAHPFARFGIDAYLAFLQGQAFVATRKTVDAERAIESFSRAIEVARDFAAAYAALADAHILLAQLTPTSGYSSLVTVEAHDRAQTLLARALQLDPSLGEAYILRAGLKAFNDDAAGAEADYRKGLALSPSYGVGYGRFAEFLYGQPGRFDEALAAIDRARLLDPLTPRHHYFKALMLDVSGKISEAEALYLQTLEVDADFHPALLRIAELRRTQQGRFAEAVKLAERAAAIDPRADWVRSLLVEFYLELADVTAARDIVMEQPSAQPLQWVPICLFVGALERGARLVRTNPETIRIRAFKLQSLEAYVMRDAALAFEHSDDARNEIVALLGRLNGNPSSNSTLAQLNMAMGNRLEGERLARDTLDLENEIRADGFPHPNAVALAVLGQNDAALDTLRRNFDQGLRANWWYTILREPAFEPLRSDPRFKALVSDAQAHAAAQRALLEQMRERGEVPRRAASAGSAPIC
jgi:TolB-like protein/DNA-binding winged helix-turn-helix (wHTH) protein/Tfp pilus assembly protein PilF